MRCGHRMAYAASRAGLAGLCVAFAGLASASEASPQLALGKRLFTQQATPACALCHTLKHAEAEGAVGPILDELKPDPARVMKALRNGLGQMPSYRDKLSEVEIQALAAYVSKAVGSAR